LGTCSLSPSLLGHNSVIYFWKVFGISFYKALDIMG
jgi:hypothetical protein